MILLGSREKGAGHEKPLSSAINRLQSAGASMIHEAHREDPVETRRAASSTLQHKQTKTSGGESSGESGKGGS